MSQPNMSENNVLNGLPPNSNAKPQVPFQERPAAVQRPSNGMDSLHSSRDSSPGTRLATIPLVQLPPSRQNIPSSQLPPVAGGVPSLSHNFDHLNINSPSLTQSTPNVSPRPQTFTTSTPVLQQPNVDGQKQDSGTRTFTQSNTYSPIVSSTVQPTAAKNVNIPVSVFTHSASSHFTNVPLNTQTDVFNKPVQEAKNTIPEVAKQSQHSSMPLSSSTPLQPSNLAQNSANIYEKKQHEQFRTMPVSQQNIVGTASNVVNGPQNHNVPYSSGLPYSNIPPTAMSQPSSETSHNNFGQIFNNGQTVAPPKIISGSNQQQVMTTLSGMQMGNQKVFTSTSQSGIYQNHKPPGNSSQQPFVQNYNARQIPQSLYSQQPIPAAPMQSLPPPPQVNSNVGNPPQQLQNPMLKSSVHSNRYPTQPIQTNSVPTQQSYQQQQQPYQQQPQPYQQPQSYQQQQQQQQQLQNQNIYQPQTPGYMVNQNRTTFRITTVKA